MNIKYDDIALYYANTMCYLAEDGTNVQFETIEDIEDVEFAKMQFAAALNLCNTSKEVERHMRINGLEGSLCIYSAC